MKILLLYISRNLVPYVINFILGKDKMVLVVGARGPGHGWRPQ